MLTRGDGPGGSAPGGDPDDGRACGGDAPGGDGPGGSAPGGDPDDGHARDARAYDGDAEGGDPDGDSACGGDDPGGQPTELALFDFDGTITYADTFVPFVRLAAGPLRAAALWLPLFPLLLAYRKGWVPASTVRREVARAALGGRRESGMRALGRSYHREVLRAQVRPEAARRLRWHQRRNHRVVVVSASLDLYLEPWCAEQGVELICTRVEARGGWLTGRYAGGDCSGVEKARRVRGAVDLGEYRRIYAYGDSSEDEPLLTLAHERYFRWRRIEV